MRPGRRPSLPGTMTAPPNARRLVLNASYYSLHVSQRRDPTVTNFETITAISVYFMGRYGNTIILG